MDDGSPIVYVLSAIEASSRFRPSEKFSERILSKCGAVVEVSCLYFYRREMEFLLADYVVGELCVNVAHEKMDTVKKRIQHDKRLTPRDKTCLGQDIMDILDAIIVAEREKSKRIACEPASVGADSSVVARRIPR